MANRSSWRLASGVRPNPLWLRPLASTSGRLLIGTEGASFPFWSPDGRSIGFFAEQKLKRFDVDSQAIQILADAPVGRGGAWQADGTILFAPTAAGPLFRVPATTGAQPSAATRLENGQNDHRAPIILPDGKHFLYYAEGRRKSAGCTWLASMAPSRSGCSTRTVPPSTRNRVTCCLPGRASCWRSPSMLHGWPSPVRPFTSRTTSPSIPGSASPHSPPQHPDRLRTAPTASVERSSHGSIVQEGVLEPLRYPDQRGIRQSFTLARREPDRLQPRCRWELGCLANGHARRFQPVHDGWFARLQSSLVIGRPADLLPVEQFKHLPEIGDRRHARAGTAERPNDDLPIGSVAGRKRASLYPGHGSVSRPLVCVARCRPHASPIRSDGLPRTRRPVFSRRQVDRISIE